MTGTRYKSAWIWVAITAVVLASVARTQSGLELARVYAHPVFVFLSAEHTAQSQAAVQAAQRADSVRGGRQQDGGSALWLELMPVLFVGLLLPLGLLSPRSFLSTQQAYSTPLLPSLFQRPPPAHLL